LELGRYRATNSRGQTLEVGEGSFSAVELLLTAMACCAAGDVDYITNKRSEPDYFSVEAHGDKVRDEEGNHLVNLEVIFEISFPADANGEAARTILPHAIAQSRVRLCTVSRTLALPNDVSFTLNPGD
jgi:uncharacterized OsmC-like protein